LGTVPLAGGQARITTTFAKGGSHSISANYSGDSIFPAASSTFGIQAVGTAASLTLTANPNASIFGQAVTLTATLGAGGTAGAAAPSGLVQFFDGTALLGSAAVNSGAAALTVANFIPGAHQLTAAYAGDSSWPPSASPAVTQTVNKAPTVITLTALSGATQATLSSVVSTSSATAIPTGSVDYMDPGTAAVLASAPLVGGAATSTIDSAGRMIVAVYAGDANFLGSRSLAAAQFWIGNGASFTSASFAPNEIVTVMGTDLAAATLTVTDSTGAAQPASPSYAGSGQINFVLPGNLPSGQATVAVTKPDGTTVSIAIPVAASAPGIFTASANGKGAAQGLVLDVQPTSVSTVNTTDPISLNFTDSFYLELFGTGFDNVRADQVTVTINGQPVPVLFAGAQQQYPGLDQINVGPLPTNLKGAGPVNVDVQVNGQAANTVTLTFQ
jgi:uncharacterized protein (TIGR03437 family)